MTLVVFTRKRKGSLVSKTPSENYNERELDAGIHSDFEKGLKWLFME